MTTYAHRPSATGLHAKLLREARERSPYVVARSTSGLPNAVRVFRVPNIDTPIWTGHRDLIPNEYRFAHDPHNVLNQPTSD